MSEAWRRKLGTGGRWTEEEARAALAAWKASGEALSSFSRRTGVQVQRLARWRDRLAGVATLVPVSVTCSTRACSALTIGVVRIEVADLEQVSPAWIGAVASALGEVGS